jgi:hypothetical protein
MVVWESREWGHTSDPCVQQTTHTKTQRLVRMLRNILTLGDAFPLQKYQLVKFRVLHAI